MVLDGNGLFYQVCYVLRAINALARFCSLLLSVVGFMQRKHFGRKSGKECSFNKTSASQPSQTLSCLNITGESMDHVVNINHVVNSLLIH